MALLQEWQKIAYNEQADRAKLQKFWQDYFLVEKGIYEKLLDHPDEEVSGTVKELADKYQVSLMEMTGFLDGIDESLKERNPLETMEEDTPVNLMFDKELLYKNMVDAKAVLHGRAEVVTDEAEQVKAMLLLCTAYDPKGMGRFSEYMEKYMSATRVVRIVPETVTGKSYAAPEKEPHGCGGHR